MSLYLGHLSPHVRREELERVFRRFGRSNVQLKDGYGFVIYEVTADAERALRKLRGKIICGERISLSWANKQPGHSQRFAKSTRFYEPRRGRNFREDNGVGIRRSQDQRDFSMATSRVPIYNHGEHQVDDALDKETGFTGEDIDDIGGEKGLSSKEGLVGEGGTIKHNPVENDRWGEPVSDAVTDHGMEDGSEFDRYEPYHGYNRRDVKKNSHIGSSYSSPAQGSSPGKGRREHSIDATERHLDRSKPQTCYICGLAGHIMCNCPQGDARREKFSRFNHRGDRMNFRGRGEWGLKRLRSTSRGRPNASADPFVLGRCTTSRKGSHSGKARRMLKSESFRESMRKHRPKLIPEYQVKKRSRQEHGTLKKTHNKRRARRSGTSSLSSDSSASSSKSHSPSSRSISGNSSSSHSRLTSSGSRSASSSSSSASSTSKSVSSRLRSRSSSLRSLSLSVSLDRKLPSSPKDVHIDAAMSTSPNGNSKPATSPESKHLLHADLENSKLKGASSGLKDEIAFTQFQADDETNGELPGHNGDDAKLSACRYMKKNSCIDPLENVATTWNTSENHGQRTDQCGALSAKPNMQTQVRCEASNSTRITAREMCLVLRHYGLKAPEEDESGISVEGYFGAARLWPWEMIYYQRLKKGPISTENYARRVEQNREFGIVDKYIRSSSGWGESDRNHT